MPGSTRALLASLSQPATLQELDQLTDLQGLPNERIGGVSCFRYTAGRDVEKQIATMRSALESRPQPDRELIERMAEYMRAMETSYEFWTGKDDYLVKRIIVSARFTPDSNNVDFVGANRTIEYFDFGQPTKIEPPLDAGRNLLPGWYPY
jgi:hypothetical protein